MNNDSIFLNKCNELSDEWYKYHNNYNDREYAESIISYYIKYGLRNIYSNFYPLGHYDVHLNKFYSFIKQAKCHILVEGTYLRQSAETFINGSIDDLYLKVKALTNKRFYISYDNSDIQIDYLEFESDKQRSERLNKDNKEQLLQNIKQKYHIPNDVNLEDLAKEISNVR